MEDEPKKKRYGEIDCIMFISISAVAGIFAGLWYETGQTFGKWIEAELCSVFAAFIVVGIIMCIPLGAIDQYKDKNKSVGIFTLIAACVIANVVFLLASRYLRKLDIEREENRREEIYQEAYEDAAREAREDLREHYEEEYFSLDEVEDIADEAFSSGYCVGYEDAYNDEDEAYNSGYNEGFDDGEEAVFRAIKGLGITDMDGEDIMAEWGEYFEEMVSIYGMNVPTSDRKPRKLVGTPGGAMHVDGCEELWGIDINSFTYFDSVEEGENAGFDPSCEVCDPHNCPWVRLEAEEE